MIFFWWAKPCATILLYQKKVLVSRKHLRDLVFPTAPIARFFQQILLSWIFFGEISHLPFKTTMVRPLTAFDCCMALNENRFKIKKIKPLLSY